MPSEGSDGGVACPVEGGDGLGENAAEEVGDGNMLGLRLGVGVGVGVGVWTGMGGASGTSGMSLVSFQ